MTDAAYDYRLECPALQDLAPGQAIHVTHWRGTEAVSRLYCFEVTFAVRQADLPLEQLLNQPATLFAHKPDGSVLRWHGRSEEHTSELQSLMRSSYAVFCLKNKTKRTKERPCNLNI